MTLVKRPASRQAMRCLDLTSINHWPAWYSIITRQFGSGEMNRLKIPHDALVFVGDGRKALFLRNDGDEKFPNLRAERVFEDVNPPTHEQGTERPGRVSKARDAGQRSAVEPVDWHHLEERRFAKRVAAAMEDVVRARKVPALVVVAPPKTLADLRSAFHADVRERVIAEINKDLTKHPVGEIEKHLTAA
ncbi:baeRF12 domain-containing protein [Bradyrhizobium sp. USDA 4452]